MAMQALQGVMQAHQAITRQQVEFIQVALQRSQPTDSDVSIAGLRMGTPTNLVTWPGVDPKSIRKLDKPLTLGGVAGELRIDYIGRAHWEALDDNGGISPFVDDVLIHHPALSSLLYPNNGFVLSGCIMLWHWVCDLISTLPNLRFISTISPKGELPTPTVKTTVEPPDMPLPDPTDHARIDADDAGDDGSIPDLMDRSIPIDDKFCHIAYVKPAAMAATAGIPPGAVLTATPPPVVPGPNTVPFFATLPPFEPTPADGTPTPAAPAPDDGSIPDLMDRSIPDLMDPTPSNDESSDGPNKSSDGSNSDSSDDAIEDEDAPFSAIDLLPLVLAQQTLLRAFCSKGMITTSMHAFDMEIRDLLSVLLKQSSSHCVHSVCQLEGYCNRATLICPKLEGCCQGAKSVCPKSQIRYSRPAQHRSSVQHRSRSTQRVCDYEPKKVCNNVSAPCPKLKPDSAFSLSSERSCGQRRSDHGLNAALLSRVKHLAKVKLLTMPTRSDIPDSAEYIIELEGKTVGKYCRHCNRFVFGASQHFTKEHEGKFRFEYKGAMSDGVNSSLLPTPMAMKERDKGKLSTVLGKV